MYEALLGSLNKERILMFINSRGQGYAREISKYFNTDLTPIQKQLEKLERGAILCSRNAGRTRLYSFNLGYPLIKEIKAFLDKAMMFMPDDERNRLVMNRRRPRRQGKPL